MIKFSFELKWAVSAVVLWGSAPGYRFYY